MDVASTTDVSDVTNYLQAFNHVRHKLHAEHDGLPISTRLLCEAHAILLNNVRGEQKMPGEIRRSQNWIGGTRPGNAVHVPPPHTEVGVLLGRCDATGEAAREFGDFDYSAGTSWSHVRTLLAPLDRGGLRLFRHIRVFNPVHFMDSPA